MALDTKREEPCPSVVDCCAGDDGVSGTEKRGGEGEGEGGELCGAPGEAVHCRLLCGPLLWAVELGLEIMKILPARNIVQKSEKGGGKTP